MRILLAAVVVTALATGCAAKRETALKDTKTLTKATEKGDFEKTLEEADAHWKKRIDINELKKSIDLMEKAAKMDSPGLSADQRTEKLAGLYEKLARAYYFLADSHIRLQAKEEGEMDEQMMDVFEKGVTAAEKAIALRDPKFAATVNEDESKWAEAVEKANPEAIPALYWYSTNLGKWALLEGIATILARKDDIKATMEWIVQNDPKYFYGAPYRYFGVYHTKVPIGGGNPPKSREAFEKSLQIAPNYLATRVLMAESYAVLVGDRKMFEKLLQDTLAADPAAIPDLVPENTLEQRKAKRLLAREDDLFY